MTNSSMTKGEYSKIEKENGSNIKCSTSGSHTRGSETYNTMLRLKIQHLLLTLIKEYTNDARKLYKLVSQLTGQKEDNPLPEDDDGTKLAEQFRQFFTNKVINIRKIFHSMPSYKTQQDTIVRFNKFSTISEADLKTVVNLMPSKSCELDILNISTLKKVTDMYFNNHQSHQSIIGQGRILCKLENCCCKTFNQIKTKRYIKSNYQPVSNLIFISKIAEKCPLEQFNKHCDDYDLLPEYQSAYRKYYSCETGLLKLINDILWNMENKLVTAVTIWHLSAAFDTVDHYLLLEVLHNKFGIDGHAMKWYNDYLKPRKFKVNINGVYSTEKSMQFSIPQGSV